VGYFLYGVKQEGFRSIPAFRSAGKLVARYFVENPNGYRQVGYLDGNIQNVLFTNLRWIASNNDIGVIRPCVRIATREEQLKCLREKLDLAIRFEKALVAGTEREFIYRDLRAICAQKVEQRFKSRSKEFKEDLIGSVLLHLLEQTGRGMAIVSLEGYIGYWISIIFKQYRERRRSAKYNPEWLAHNSIDEQ
jgi:hypothetical protein